jgi:phosphate transport system substrate-binding protein
LTRRDLLGLLAGTVAARALAGCGPRPMTALRISGSNTVFAYARELAVKFRERRRDVSFRITGDGTSRGIKFAGEGDIQGLPEGFTNRNKFMAPAPMGEVSDSRNGEPVDLGISSRALFSSEREAYSSMVATPFAYDGIAVVANRSVTARGLTREQLRRIYAGAIRNWREVGGADAPIVVIARDALSGTAEAWGELVMAGMPVMAATLIAQAEDVPAAVASMPNAIAYLSLAQIDEAMMVPLAIDGVAPTVPEVASGRYPIKRPFMFVTGGPPTALQAAFIDFAFSPEGQAVVTGLAAVPAMRAP